MGRRVEYIDIGGRLVGISNPDKVLFPAAKFTKMDLVLYYLAVAEGALRAVGGRPMALKRYPNGVAEPFFYQKRAPDPRPDWIETIEIRFPSGRTAQEIVVRDPAQLAWVVNLGCIDLHPHLVRTDDLDHPDELRIDLDPVPGVPWGALREVARETRAVLGDHGLRAFVKTSGSRGVHVYARIAPRWPFADVRHAALAVAREVSRRLPRLATSAWWKEERHGVFLDFNQNARDRTTAAAYSVRPTPDARVSMPLDWPELDRAEPGDFTLRTVPPRFAKKGDAWAGLDDAAGSLDALLVLSARQLAEAGEAPLPPHFDRAPGEPRRAPPSRRRPRDTKPVVTIARAQEQDAALDGLRRWLALHPAAARHLQPRDVLVDAMRGRASTWTRVRINLEHVPAAERPGPGEVRPDPDFDPRAAR